MSTCPRFTGRDQATLLGVQLAAQRHRPDRARPGQVRRSARRAWRGSRRLGRDPHVRAKQDESLFWSGELTTVPALVRVLHAHLTRTEVGWSVCTRALPRAAAQRAW
jgi:hypothetical protein